MEQRSPRLYAERTATGQDPDLLGQRRVRGQPVVGLVLAHDLGQGVHPLAAVVSVVFERDNDVLNGLALPCDQGVGGFESPGGLEPAEHEIGWDVACSAGSASRRLGVGTPQARSSSDHVGEPRPSSGERIAGSGALR